MMAPYNNSKKKLTHLHCKLLAIATALTCIVVMTGCSFTPREKPNTNPSCTVVTKASEMPELRVGYTGECVKVLENLLIKTGYLFDDHEITGNFDAAVKQGVVDFQLEENDLYPDGTVGSRTWPKLMKLFDEMQLTPAPKPTVTAPPEVTESPEPSEEPEPEPTPTPTPTPEATPPTSSASPSATPTPTKPPTTTKPPTATPSEPPVTDPAYSNRFGPNTTKHVVLSFDDCSYSKKKSDAVIKMGKDLGVSLVFAVQGDCVKSGYFDVDAARAAGHFVINHSYDHPKFLSMSYDQIMAQLNHGVFKTNYARTPYGQGSFHEKGREKILKALEDSHMRLWTWSIDSNDWGEPAPNASGPKTLQQIIQRIARDLPSSEAVAAKRGDTILLHMNHASFTPDGIKRLVKVVESKGLTVCPNSGKPTPLYPTEQDFCR